MIYLASQSQLKCLKILCTVLSCPPCSSSFKLTRLSFVVVWSSLTFCVSLVKSLQCLCDVVSLKFLPLVVSSSIFFSCAGEGQLMDIRCGTPLLLMQTVCGLTLKTSNGPISSGIGLLYKQLASYSGNADSSTALGQ